MRDHFLHFPSHHEEKTTMPTPAPHNAETAGPILGLITARGGSKRIPGKNLRIVGGKPLLAWTIEAALQSRLLSRVVLSTDDPQIAAAGRLYGAEVPFLRPAELATDTSAHILCVLDALDRLRDMDGFAPTAVCLLQPTSPLRQAGDIDALLSEAAATRPFAMVSVNACTEHPYFARSVSATGELMPFVPQNLAYAREQDLEPACFINGAIYYNTVESLRKHKTFYPEGLRGHLMPRERSLQVDEPFDLHLADLLLSNPMPSTARSTGCENS